MNDLNVDDYDEENEADDMFIINAVGKIQFLVPKYFGFLAFISEMAK
ncbi:18521_t:CDS:2 [Entrophospora sp. SA101]|nr:18521_t:CDS:2 [Entrophospora sp. SA101]